MFEGTETSGTAEMLSLGETKEECITWFDKEAKKKTRETEGVLGIIRVGEPIYDEKREVYVFAIRTIWNHK